MNRFFRAIGDIARRRLSGKIARPRLQGLAAKPATRIENKVTIYYKPESTQVLPGLDLRERLKNYGVFFEARKGFTTIKQLPQRIVAVEKMPPEDVIKMAANFGIAFQERRVFIHPE